MVNIETDLWRYKLTFLNLFCLFCVGLIFFVVHDNSINWDDLSINLLATFIATTITAFFVEFYVEQKQKEKLIPIRIAMYREIQLFFSVTISIVEKMYYDTHINRKNLFVKELFSEITISEITSKLDVSKKPCGISCDWLDYIERETFELEKIGNDILNRYSRWLDPAVFHLIFYIINEYHFLGHGSAAAAKMTMDSDQKLGKKVAPLHENYYLPEYKDICALVQKALDWCELEFTELLKYDKSKTIHKIKVHISSINAHKGPTSVFDTSTADRYTDDILWEKYVDENGITTGYLRTFGKHN